MLTRRGASVAAGSRCSTSSCSRRSPWYSLHFQPVHQLRQRRSAARTRLAGVDVIEGDGIEGAAAARHLDPHLQVPLADHARVADAEDAIEARLGKAWPQGPPARSACAVSSAISSTRRAHRRSRPHPADRAAPASARTSASKARAKRSSCARSSVSPAAMAWPPKLADELRIARRDGIEHVADVDPRDRARRAAQRRRIGAARRRSPAGAGAP